jgi:uncharacterized protein (TIGR00369 family)
MDEHAEARRLWMIAEAQPNFAKHLGLRITVASRDQVEAELLVGEHLANRNGVMHGGAIMALADNLGGTATLLNLPDGASTATIESKTNFFRPIPLRQTALAVCVPLHRGRRTMVWQTTVMDSDQKPAAIVVQTQLVDLNQ